MYEEVNSGLLTRLMLSLYHILSYSNYVDLTFQQSEVCNIRGFQDQFLHTWYFYLQITALALPRRRWRRFQDCFAGWSPTGKKSMDPVRRNTHTVPDRYCLHRGWAFCECFIKHESFGNVIFAHSERNIGEPKMSNKRSQCSGNYAKLCVAVGRPV